MMRSPFMNELKSRRRSFILQSAATAALTLSARATVADAAFLHSSKVSSPSITRRLGNSFHGSFGPDLCNNNFKNSLSGVAFMSSSSTTNDKSVDVTGDTTDVTPTKSGIGNWDEILPFEKGSHNAAKIIIPPADATENPEEDPFASSTFQKRLEATIATCRELKKSSMWIQVPMSRAGLMEDMFDFGLRFHNAEGDTANLCLWLDENIESKIPTYATHQVGVGALVVNSRNEILCVRELRNNYRKWKIPGGLAELGEQLDEAAIREVFEETGVPCNFMSVLGVRHTHGMQFGRSDLYFVCRLQPIEEVDKGNDDGVETAIIPDPVAQEGEIEAAAWVPLEEYREMIENQEGGHPMMQHIMNLHDQETDMQKTILQSIVPGRKPSPVYHATLRPDSN